jgi:hypothetical protein
VNVLPILLLTSLARAAAPLSIEEEKRQLGEVFGRSDFAKDCATAVKVEGVAESELAKGRTVRFYSISTDCRRGISRTYQPRQMLFAVDGTRPFFFKDCASATCSWSVGKPFALSPKTSKANVLSEGWSDASGEEVGQDDYLFYTAPSTKSWTVQPLPSSSYICDELGDGRKTYDVRESTRGAILSAAKCYEREGLKIRYETRIEASASAAPKVFDEFRTGWAELPEAVDAYTSVDAESPAFRFVPGTVDLKECRKGRRGARLLAKDEWHSGWIAYDRFFTAADRDGGMAGPCGGAR